ncbi:TPA: anti-sigma-F factor Fin [Bacillus cereus]
MEGYYYCRHCGSNVGSVTAEKVYSDVLYQLTEQEVVEMIHFHENGNIYIKTICELCQETLASYPEYYEYEKFLQ